MTTEFGDAFDEGGLEISCKQFVNITTRGAFRAGPATADAIASALHVAAAQVRAARGEKAPELTYDARIILNRVDGKDLDVEDVRRIARDLNAWLAAHEAGK